VFLYESLWNTLGFLILFTLSRRLGHRLREGDLFALYLIWYPVGRLWIETLRPDAWKLGDIAAAQIFSLIALAVGLAILIRNRLPGRIPGTKVPTGMSEA
jgi:phosphatidylglycerol:prolipoprotein diacylglycerol transferase